MFLRILFYYFHKNVYLYIITSSPCGDAMSTPTHDDRRIIKALQ